MTTRTITKIVFHDSSDDDDTAAPTAAVVVVCDDLALCPEDLESDPADEDVARNDDEEAIMEDVTPQVLPPSRSHVVEVEAMPLAPPYTRGRRPDTPSEALSHRKRLRDEDEAGSGGEGIAGEEEALQDDTDQPAVLLPNGTGREPLMVKVSGEGYRLSLDEGDVQAVFEEEEEEEDEEEAAIDTLMMISAIEQMIAACERYRPEEEDGGNVDADAAAATSATAGPACEAVSDTPTDAHAVTGAVATAAPAISEAVPELLAPEVPAEATSTPSTSLAVAVEAEAEAAGQVPSEVPPGDEPSDAAALVTPEDDVPRRPKFFDTFVEKGRALMERMRAGELSPEALCQEMEHDVWVLGKVFMRVNRPRDNPIIINGVRMDM